MSRISRSMSSDGDEDEEYSRKNVDDEQDPEGYYRDWHQLTITS